MPYPAFFNQKAGRSLPYASILFNDRNILERFLQQQINQLIAGAVCLRGQIVQAGERFIPHAHGNNLMAVLAFFPADQNFTLHPITP